MKVISNANQILRSEKDPGLRKFAKKSSSKARRVIDRAEVEDAVEDAAEEAELAEETAAIIRDLLDSGAIFGCDCGCGGDLLMEIINNQ